MTTICRRNVPVEPRREPNGNSGRRKLLEHRVEDFKEETSTVFDRATIVVGPLVRRGLEELVDEVSVVKEKASEVSKPDMSIIFT